MTQYKTISDLKNTAKNTLDGKYSGAILILFLSTLLTGAVEFLIDMIASITVNAVYYTSGSEFTANLISFVFDLIILAAGILVGVTTAGIALYFLKIACGQPCSISDLFYAFKTDSAKCLILSAAIMVCQAVCFWPFQYLSQRYLTNRDSTWLLYTLFALLIGVCLYYTFALGISLSFFFLLDFPEKSAKEVLALCWAKMKGQRKRLFLLELSFFPLMLLCVCSFFIGFLWLNPYMQMTYTYFFLDLMNPGENT